MCAVFFSLFSIPAGNVGRPQAGGGHSAKVHPGGRAERVEGFAEPARDFRERYGRVDLQSAQDRRVRADAAESGLEELFPHLCRHLQVPSGVQGQLLLLLWER